MEIKRLAVPLLGAALIGGAVVGVGLTAMAASSTTSTTALAAPGNRGGPGGFSGGVMGTVSAINGDTITVTTKAGGTYTIDATGATVEKYANGADSTVTVSGIAVGDTVMVSGTVETATMTATDIHDGMPPAPTPPAAVGKVTAVNGSTITLSAMTRSMTEGAAPTTTTYTVDAGNATITKVAAPATQGIAPTKTTITAAQIAVGDMLMVDGTISGSNITATTITDGAGFGGRGKWKGGQN